MAWWLANQSSNLVVRDCFLGGKNRNLFLNSDIVNRLLKTIGERGRRTKFVISIVCSALVVSR